MCATPAMPCSKCGKPVLPKRGRTIYRPQKDKALCEACCSLLGLRW